ncbi:hypothetical protein OURE66S_00508 [Oligella ureolytica]
MRHLIGPVLARLGGTLLDPEFLASFLMTADYFTTGDCSVLLGFKEPEQNQHITENIEQAQALWQQIVFQPRYLIALFSALSGYGIMVFVGMTAAPIAMMRDGHELSAAAVIIQLHVLGMFFPSFFTGSLINRFGIFKVMFAGVILLAGHIVFALSGTGFINYAIALRSARCRLELPLYCQYCTPYNDL